VGDYYVTRCVEKDFSRGMKCIEPVPVVLSGREVLVPVAALEGGQPGKTLLVTGGMDGDEYAGIEAAYELIVRYHTGNFSGRLVVVPVVNVPGHLAGTSKNPMDHQYPKYIFPGNALGTPTQQLVDWLVRTHVASADAWYDLHGGASDEGLNPFLWTYRTGSKQLKQYTQQLEQQTPFTTIISERPWWLAKQERLGKHGCWYVLAESGARGEVKPEDVERHVRGVERAMQILGMIPSQPIDPMARERYTCVDVLSAAFAGVWELQARPSHVVKKGDVLGYVSYTSDGKKLPIVCPKNGVRLWWKEGQHVERGDALYAIGYT
jgi:predicted deacylase